MTTHEEFQKCMEEQRKLEDELFGNIEWCCKVTANSCEALNSAKAALHECLPSLDAEPGSSRKLRNRLDIVAKDVLFLLISHAEWIQRRQEEPKK